MKRNSQPQIWQILCLLLAGSLTLAACSLAAPAATAQPTTVEPAAPAATDPDVQPVSLDTGSLATAYTLEEIAAVPASADIPPWEVLPGYTLITLEGYPISDHLHQPRIYIFPAGELGAYHEGAGGMVTALQTLLQSPQDSPTLPFLPPFNAAQVLHAHLQFLDFQSGTGLRYLTQFNQGLVPINSRELFYTFQGLTADGKYYVAAVLPVNHPDLPPDGMITGNEPPEFISDYPAYLEGIVQFLNPQAPDSFTPDLTMLDAMMSSLKITP